MSQTETPLDIIKLTTKVKCCVKIDALAEHICISIIEVYFNLLASFQFG